MSPPILSQSCQSCGSDSIHRRTFATTLTTHCCQPCRCALERGISLLIGTKRHTLGPDSVLQATYPVSKFCGEKKEWVVASSSGTITTWPQCHGHMISTKALINAVTLQRISADSNIRGYNLQNWHNDTMHITEVQFLIFTVLREASKNIPQFLSIRHKLALQETISKMRIPNTNAADIKWNHTHISDQGLWCNSACSWSWRTSYITYSSACKSVKATGDLWVRGHGPSIARQSGTAFLTIFLHLVLSII